MAVLVSESSREVLNCSAHPEYLCSVIMVSKGEATMTVSVVQTLEKHILYCFCESRVSRALDLGVRNLPISAFKGS